MKLTLGSILLAALAAPGFAADEWVAALSAASASAGSASLKVLDAPLPPSPSAAPLPSGVPAPAPYSGSGSAIPPPAPGPAEAPRYSVGLEPTPERKELDKISVENQTAREKLSQRLRGLNEEKDELVARYYLMQEKLRMELAELENKQRRLSQDNSLFDEQSRKELAQLKHDNEKLRLQNETEREKMLTETARIDLEIRRLDLQGRRAKLDVELADAKSESLKAEIDLRAKKETWKSETNKEPEYQKEPFSGGVLTISDRKIPLNGPIVEGAADFVTERINFFNNKSEAFPIFIVIDRSPGGSVMEGYRIIKAMKASKAPVYVVVRSFAASMAAAIATLAPKSFAYPNAVILHHQMSSFVFGNMTQIKEQLETAKEWYRRIGEPVSQKMGIPLEEFTRRMYAHNSEGDWQEFADKAVELHWIDQIVHEIRETGVVKDPDIAQRPKPLFDFLEQADSKGDRFMRLPRLQPFDLYYLYNRDGYYR